MPKKHEIIKRLVSQTAEVITPEELETRLETAEELTHYIGFEISGYVHLGTGLMSSLVIKDLQDLGVHCIIWLADWHSWINEKLDGSKETAAHIGSGYFAEAMKASLLAVGGDPDKLEIRLASEWYAKDAMRYWETVIAVAKHTSLARMKRSISITGREAGEETDSAKLFYPAMQAADVFYQDISIAHAGMDQRKAHVIVRDTALQVSPGKPKPIALHHPLLSGLQKPPIWPVPEGMTQREIAVTTKMSKSQPDSAIWVHDSVEEIERKIRKAFCMEKDIQFNPILNWAKNILFWNWTEPFKIERKPEHGGTVEFATYADLEAAYATGNIHPMDLKETVAKKLAALLQPVREHFAKPEVAAKKEELDKVLLSR